MTDFYFDASAFVKRYVKEKGTQRVIEFLEEAGRIFISKVAYVETIMTFRRKKEEGTVEEENFFQLLNTLDEEWRNVASVELTDEVLRIIKERVHKHPLRALDAIHLASALTVKEQGIDFTFICSDDKLKNAAGSEGLKVIDPVIENEEA